MVYVDTLQNNGWLLYGKRVKNCHLFGDTVEELITFATGIGLKRRWLQKTRRGVYHFDLIRSKRNLAIIKGAEMITDHKQWLKINKLLAKDEHYARTKKIF